MDDKVTLELPRNQIYTLFSCLLIQDKSIFNRANIANTELLTALWKDVSVRTKEEALFNNEFRNRMDYWEVPYEEDLIKLGIPKVLEDE